VYMLWSKIVFGATSPVSGQIKRWWGSLPGNAYGGPARRIYTFFGVDTTPSDFNAWQLATAFVQSLQEAFSQWLARLNANTAFGAVSMLVLLTCLLILVSNRKRTIRASAQLGLLPLLVGAELQVIYYNSLGYSAAKEWYWVSQMIFVILLGSLLLDILLQAIRRRAPAARVLIWAATALAVIYLAQNFTKSIVQRMPYGTEKAGQPYMDVLPLLEENTEPGSLIGMTGGGNVGYFIHERTIVNMDGLINSKDYFQALQNGYADDYLEEIGLDYVFANPAILDGGPYRGQFVDRLGTAIATYGKKGLMPFLPVSAASR
ncbi:MAG: hypothetical protein GXP40_06100, partial [Chloroflexi bacterium]|nr:hypothetical protein [Chloroflexota bacterium]